MPEPNTEFENKLASSNFGNMVELPPITMPGSVKAPADMSVEELSASMRGQASLFLDKAANPYTPQLISPLQIDQTGRYNKQLVGWDNENLYGSMQSNWDKAANGVLKGLNLAGTTFLQGTVGLVAGLGAVAATGQANAFYNNDFAQALDKWNKEAENVLPNYYTAKETNANWYSPDNLFTANFLWDKLVKNIGFSIGAIYSGGVVSKGISTAMKGVGLLSEAAQLSKVVTALDEVLPATPAAARAAKFQEILTSSLPKLSAKQVDRTITSLFGAATEGGIEALQGLNEFREAKIAEFQEKNFRTPNEQEMKEINDNAASLGNARFFMNIGLLSATNYIQLPRILSSRYSTSKAIANTEAASLGEAAAIRRTAEGTFERALPTTKFGRAARATYKGAGLGFSGSEAFEEGAQFVFQEGTKDYYNKKYGGEGASFLDSLYEGVSQLSSKEGMESILLGGLSGGMQQAGWISRKGVGKTGNLGARGFIGTGGTEAQATDKLVSSLNSTASLKWFNDMQDAAARGTNLMKEQEAAIRQGDILSSKDIEADLMHNYLAVRIKNGRYDLVKEDIANLRQQASTQQGLDKLVQEGYANETDTIQTFNARLNNFEKHADNLKPTFEALSLKYGGIYKPGTQDRVYDEKVIDQMAYAVSKIADYDQRIPELSQELIARGIDIQGAIDKTEGAEDPFKQIEALQITVDQKDSLKTALEDVLEMTSRRQKFLEEYNTIAKDPTDYQEVSEEPTAPVQNPTIKITTKDGEEDIEVGVEYYLGNTVSKDENGRDVYGFPTLTILGENEDGTIKIRDGKGEIRNVSKDVLVSYKLGKVSDLQNNKKAKFYFDHINDVFEFNFGKGKKQKGRLQYSQKDKILLFTYKDQYGKIKSIEVTGDQFVPKQGFSQPMISKVGTLTAAQQKSLEEYAAEADGRRQAKRTSRLRILESLVDDTGKRLSSIQEMLQKKYSEFENISNDLLKLEQKIKAGELTKRANFKQTTNKAIKAANKLSNLQEVLRTEIQALEGERDELEFNLEYFVDLASNIDELPTDSNDFLDELKQQTADIENLILGTGVSINKISSLIDNVQKALDTALSMAREAIGQFEKKFPKAPLSADNQEFVDFLKANPNFLKNQPTYKEDLKQLEEFISQIDDLDIIPNERSLSELREQLDSLNKELQELEQQYKAKNAIVSKYEQIAEEFKAQKAAEAAVLANKEMMAKFFYEGKKAEQSAGSTTASPEEQEEAETNSAKERQEARPSISIAFDKTTTPSPITRESDKRHQRFLSKLPLLPNEKDIIAQFVTKNNEAAFGLTGLIDKHLAGYTPKEGEELILAIYSEKDGNDIYFVDENGKRIGKQGATSDAIDKEQYKLIDEAFKDGKDGYYQTPKTSKNEKYSKYSSKGWKIHVQFKKGDEARVAKHLYNNGLYFKLQNGIGTWYNSTVNSGATLYVGSAKEAIKVANFLKSTLSDTIENNKASMTGDIYGNSIYGGSGSDINFSDGIALRFDVQKTDQYKNDKKYSEYALSTGLGQKLTGLPYLSKYNKEVSELETVFEKTTPQEEKKKALKRLEDIYAESKTELEKDFGKDFLGTDSVLNPILERVNELEKSTSSSINQDAIVYAAMPSTSLEDSYGLRYSTTNTTPEQAEVWRAAWEIKRAELLSYTNQSPQEAVNVSRGIPVFSDEIQYISGTLFTEDQLNNAKAILVVSTKGTIEYQNRTINIPKGRVMIQNGSILEYANNRNFTDQEANTLYNVIKAFVAKANETGTFDNNLMSFLHGTILFESPYEKVEDEIVKNKVARNQMYFHKSNLYFGEEEFAVPFTEASVEAYKADIMFFLKNAYNNVNNTLLRQKKPFNELNADLSIKKEWPTYQHYLLSSEGRTKEEVPLSTKIRPIDPAIPNDRNFNNKYAYFNLIKIEEEKLPVIEQKAEKEETLADIIAENERKLAEETSPASTFNVAAFKDVDDSAPFSGGPIFTLENLDVTGPTEIVQPIETGAKMAEWRAKQAQQPKSPQGDSGFRVVGAYNYSLANVEEEKEYIEKNSPFSVQTIKNLIAAGNGLFAWGSYQNTLITLSERMEEGTGYHELFEGIYDVFLNKQEKARIYKEFYNRKGTFVDRETGKTVQYKDATIFQAKEEMAEEFRSFKLYETLPSEIPAESWLGKFFRDLFNWLKSIVTGEIYSLDNLFSRMDAAYYKNVPFKNVPSNVLNARVIGDFNALDTDSVIKGVVSSVFQEIYKEGDTKLINELDFGGKIPLEIYDRINASLKYYYSETYDEAGKLIPYTAFSDLLEQGMSVPDIDNKLFPIVTSIFDNWGDIITASGELLKTFKILQENENTKEDEDRENTSKDESYLADAFQWDGKKNAPASIKLLIATLQESVFVATGAPVIGEQPLKDIQAIRDSSTRMQKMVDYAKTFNALLDQLSTENSLLQKEKKIRKLADAVPEYVRIFNRLRIGKDTMSVEDWALRIKFYSTFAKQKPIALNTYINEDGTTSIGAADIDNAVKQLSTDWLSGLKSLPNITYKDDKYILDAEAKNKQGIYIIPHDTTGPTQRYKYLSVLGINFSSEQIANMSKEDQSDIADAVSSMRKQISGETDVTSLYKLQIKGPLDKIFKIFLKTQNLVPASVFSDLQGNYRQTFVQTNSVSRMANDINAAPNRDVLFQDLPHLTQQYSKDSDYINNILYNQEGTNLHKDLLIKYIQGIVTRDGDKNVPTEKLSKAKKLMQAINQNLNENYYLLIPADSQTEWMIGLKNKYLGLTDAALEQFYSYYQGEQILGGSSKRLFSMLKDGLDKEKFDKAFSDFVFNEAAQQFQELTDYNVIQAKSNGKYEWTGLDQKYAESNSLKHDNLSLEQVEQIIMERTVNFMYNNIEIQKMFFGDPAAYKAATKRYKSFLSPREQALYDTPEFDAQANKEFHTIAGVKLKVGDPGYLLYRNSLKTISTSDVFSANDLPGYLEINGSDGQGISTLVAYKQMRIKNGFRWSTKDEENFQYLTAQDRLLMAKDGLYKYTDKALREHDEALEQPKELSRFSPLKPIVSGFNENGPILDKYSIAAITYAAVRGTNWALQYKRMLDNQIGYIIYESGRKVGVKGTDSIYSTEAYKTSSIEEVPFKWFGIQVETGGDEKSQTWGSQTGKLNTVNLLNAGLPIDYEGDYDQWYVLSEEEKLKASPIYTLVTKEKSVRVAMIENGYQQLLDKIGINKDGTVSKKKLLALIKDELTRRELNDNIKEALQMEGEDFAIPLEALTNYEQIKSIIFSYVSKYISAPKVNGGAKIQVSGSGWEVAGQRIVKSSKGGKTIYTAAGLKFYTKEEPWMEVMLPNWFAKKIRQIPSLRDLTNEELINYINNSPDSKELLSGIGFRIPTQELNSIENFRVKAFLPEEFGDMIVVPEALTKKSGGDFDVDKLNTYLKNVYINSIGELAVVPYYGQGEEALVKFREIAKDYLTKILELSGKDRVEAFFNDDVRQDYTEENKEYSKEEIKQFNKEIEEDLNKDEKLAQKLYKQSLENEYFRTLDQILSLPQNFDRLVVPNNSKELENLREVLEIISQKEFGQGAIRSILSPTYMNTLRHMYISGKSNVGIAASAQTQNAVSQKTAIIIDPSKISQLKDSIERGFIGDATVNLPSNSIKIKGKTYQTISLAKDRAGRYISDKISQFINGFVDIAADPFLVQIGVTRDNAGTFMFLERIGVPTDTTVYFMNQPIIREYNKQLERNGQSYPFIEDNLAEILQQFPTNKEIPNDFPTKGLESLLKTNIDQFYNASLTQEENAFQHFVLSEYLKYSVMASNLFRLSQATNYDTAKFSDPYLYIRKALKTKDAETNNIFSSAEDSLKNTFVGPIASRIGDATRLISNSFFKFIHEGITPYIFPVIETLAERKKMNDLEFVKAARKVEQSFINFLSQTSTGLNERIKELLIDEETSAARLLEQMKNKLEAMPNNPFKVLSSFITEDKDSPTSTKTIKIFNKGTTAFEQNTFIAAMQELQFSPVMKELYGKLARVAFLQSGIAKSPISFTELLPVETFKAFILPAIQSLSNPELLKAFIQTDSFYKNNWKDPIIVPKLIPKIEYEMNEFGEDEAIIKSEFVSAPLNSYASSRGNTNFRAFKVSTKSGSFSSDFATMTLGKGKERKTWLLKKLINPTTNKPVLKAYSVKYPENQYAIYYAVNPLGDGYKGQEHYSNIRQSVFSNEGVKQEAELSPEEVIRAMQGEINTPLTNNVVPLPQSAPTEEDFEADKQTLKDGDLVYTKDRQGKIENFIFRGHTDKKARIEGWLLEAQQDIESAVTGLSPKGSIMTAGENIILYKQSIPTEQIQNKLGFKEGPCK